MEMTSNNKSTSDGTSQLNTFDGKETQTFSSQGTFIRSLKRSKAYKDVSVPMHKAASTSNALKLSTNDTDIILETSIDYTSSSSVSHFDYKTYTGTR